MTQRRSSLAVTEDMSFIWDCLAVSFLEDSADQTLQGMSLRKSRVSMIVEVRLVEQVLRGAPAHDEDWLRAALCPGPTQPKPFEAVRHDGQ